MCIMRNVKSNELCSMYMFYQFAACIHTACNDAGIYVPRRFLSLYMRTGEQAQRYTVIASIISTLICLPKRISRLTVYYRIVLELTRTHTHILLKKRERRIGKVDK